MSFRLGKRRLTSLAAMVAGAYLLLGAGRAAAQPCDPSDPFPQSQVTVDAPGAVLVFPKIVFTSGRDTIIQISNTFNMMARARCFYIDARLLNPEQPADPNLNPSIWQETDFTITLTRQQPTHWVASFGRQVDPTDLFGQNSGLDPGAVPPVTEGFQGELKCVVVDDSDTPIPGNWLKGEATIRSRTRDVSSYNAIALRAGRHAGDTGNSLLLDGIGKSGADVNNPDPDNMQYTSCPNTLLFDYIAYGLPSPVVQGLGGPCVNNNCPINTTLTLVPCFEDMENQVPGRVNVSFSITNEFEEILSGATTVNCWLDVALDLLGGGGQAVNNPFVVGVLGSATGLARITPADGQGGILGIAEETHSSSIANTGARAAFNLQHEGSRACFLASDSQDRIILSAPF